MKPSPFLSPPLFILAVYGTALGGMQRVADIFSISAYRTSSSLGRAGFGFEGLLGGCISKMGVQDRELSST